MSITPQQLSRQLSPHFRLEEFTRSATASRLGLDNTPPPKAVASLQALCTHVLEPLRQRFGAIRITSGYRSAALNRAVGGVPTSQHLSGQAADLHVGSREVGQKMYAYVVQHLDFDQLLFERSADGRSRWLHVSYRADGHNRRHHDADYVATLRHRQPWLKV